MKYLKKYLIIIFLIICVTMIAGWVADIFFKAENKKEKSQTVVESEGEKIGWITDIHADKSKEMDGGESGIILSNKFKEYFPAFLDEMQKEKIETVIITGDNVHSGKLKYAEDLKDISQKYNIKILWVKGNHDRESARTMEILGVAEPYYYSYDTKNTRIIVLNLANENKAIDEKQLGWLKEKLLETKLPIIVAMHLPIIDYEKRSVFSKFENLESVVRENGETKFIISGSLHMEKEAWLNGIFYKTAYPLTLKDHLGSYYVIDMENNKINSSVVLKNL